MHDTNNTIKIIDIANKHAKILNTNNTIFQHNNKEQRNKMNFILHGLAFYLLVFANTLQVNCEDIECGKQHPNYEKIDVKKVKKNEGNLVMVQSRITYPKTEICTKKKCIKECCNYCRITTFKFKKGKVNLQGDDIGCYGNNCNVREKCPYSKGDEIVVYGKVTKEYGRIYVNVDKHCTA